MLERLAAGGASAALLQRVRDARDAHDALAACRLRLSSVRTQRDSVARKLVHVSVDVSDDEDGEAVERFQNDVGRVLSCHGRLQRVVRGAEKEVAERKEAYERCVQLVGEAVRPEMGAVDEE